MLKTKLLIAVTVASLALGSATGFAQTQPDPHHPAQGAEEVAAPTSQTAAGMDMMNMMAGMMKMMSGGQMGMGGMDMAGMGMTEHVEGRIAFLRAELQITDAQAKLWDAYAGALRDNAKRLKEGGSMMTGMQGPALLGQLDQQEKTLSARLEGVKAMKASLEPLYKALTEDQRKIADELLPAHMGMMQGGMMQGGMMQGGMMQGGMMQGGASQGGSMPMQNNSQ